jgi:hypothetical protein
VCHCDKLQSLRIAGFRNDLKRSRSFTNDIHFAVCSSWRKTLSARPRNIVCCKCTFRLKAVMSLQSYITFIMVYKKWTLKAYWNMQWRINLNRNEVWLWAGRTDCCVVLVTKPSGKMSLAEGGGEWSSMELAWVEGMGKVTYWKASSVYHWILLFS